MKILYLAHRIPYPPNKGDKIRSFNEIKFLSKSHQIYLCCLADNPRDLQYKSDLKAYCRTVDIVPIDTRLAKLKSLFYLFSEKPLSIPYFYSRKLQKAVDRLLATMTFDCLLCFSSPMAEYIFRSSELGRGNSSFPPQLVMDFCDVDSHKWAQYGQTSSLPFSLLYRLEGHRLTSYESKIEKLFDHSVVISPREAEIFRDQNPHVSRINVVSNGVDYNYFTPDEQHLLPSEPLAVSKRPVLLFTGAMDYHANIDGVLWFCEKIFPNIKACIPEVQFYIVGSNPHRKIKLLENGDDIIVTGFVEDVRPYYQRADVCVVPLRLGRGVQNKVLEAMAMGKAVVTTSKALEGIEAITEKHLLVGDDQESIHRSILMLLQSKPLRSKLGSKARQYVKASYNWSTNMKKLESLLQANQHSPILAESGSH